MPGSGHNSAQQQNNNSAQMEDSDSDYERENIRPRGLTGLQNLGNTCYLNSALQSLSNCPPLTQYFLDCEPLIRSDKSPMLSKSYLKLITELWHKKRPSYVVPSGIVTGIKAVHPMFRGFTQQDAQEFLRCLMDQLHEELKLPVVVSDDEMDDDDEDDDDEEEGDENNDYSDDNANNTNNAVDQINPSPDRRPSCDSTSSQEEEEYYETCDSGHSSESCSTSGRDVGSGDENGNGSCGEDGGGAGKDEEMHRDINRSRKLSALSAGSGNEEYYTPVLDMVANTKEMKETANLLEKETENRRGKVLMEGGDSKEQGHQGCGGVETSPAPVSTTVAAGAGGATATGTTSSPSSKSVPKDGGEVQANNTAEKKTTSSPSSSRKPNRRKPRKLPNVRHDSIISQTFDGKILSSVRCLNCETVSTTKETFQDLSLPIPSKDHLHMLHSGYPSMTGGGVSPPKGGACGEVNQGWLASVLTWMKSWFVGPTVTLQDCLAAFFSADELKGDNMYSCGKCKKLRNGLKYSKVLELPEILSIHLKRFRHEFYSSKISTYISFPLEGLNMEPYADKDCRNEVMTYDLVAIICHHGTAGGGHYTAYCLNHLNGQWYEFDDQYVTEVDVNQVINCEAYVLFYRKSNKKIEPIRQKIYEAESDEERASILKFYISRPWLSRFHTFAEPGPITNMDFLCKHGGVPPAKVPLLDHLIAEIPQDTWEILYNRFGGGMVCNHLFACKVCQNELQRLKQRQKSEREVFIKLNEEFQDDEYSGPVFAISMAWFRQWEGFARERYDTPPEAVDNTNISVIRNGQPVLRQSSDHGHLSRDMWQFLHKIYGGGPEILFRNSTGTVMKTSNTMATGTGGTATAAAISSTAPSVGSSSSSPIHQQTHLPHQQNKATLASIAAAASASGSSSFSSSFASASSYSSSSSSSSSSVSPSSSSIYPQVASSSSSSIASSVSPLSSNPNTPPTTISSPPTPPPASSSLKAEHTAVSDTDTNNKVKIDNDDEEDQAPSIHASSYPSSSTRSTEIQPNSENMDMDTPRESHSNDKIDNDQQQHGPISPLPPPPTSSEGGDIKKLDDDSVKRNSIQKLTTPPTTTPNVVQTANNDDNEIQPTATAALTKQSPPISCQTNQDYELPTQTTQVTTTTAITAIPTTTVTRLSNSHSTNSDSDRQSRLSQDSGISCRASPSPISEDQSLSGVDNNHDDKDDTQRISSGNKMNSASSASLNRVGESEIGVADDDKDTRTVTTTTNAAVVGGGEDKDDGGDAGHGATGATGATGGAVAMGVADSNVRSGGGGKGRNRKKKNKNMEVTRI